MKLLLRFIPLLLVIAMGIWITQPNDFVILRPRLGVPAVQLAGETFEIVVKQTQPFGQRQWQAMLQRPHQDDVILPIESERQQGAKRILTVRIPTEAHNGAYSLQLSQGEQYNRQIKAVHIKTSFDNNVRFIHLADQEGIVGDEERYTRMLQQIEEINLINPDFVLISGDIAGNGRWPEYQRMKEILAKLDAPVVVAPGNHEYRGWGGYLATFAYPYHQVDIGNYSILSLNSSHGRDQLTQSQYRWVRAQLKQHRTQVNLVQMHHPMFFRRNLIGMRDELVNEFNHYQVPAVFAGHWHSDAIFNNKGERQMLSYIFPGTKYIITTAAAAGARPSDAVAPPHNGYRLVRMLGNQIRNYSTDFDGDGYRDADSSIPSGKIQINTQADGSINVINALYEDFKRATVTLSAPADQKISAVNYGHIVQIISAGKQKQYQIEFDLPADSRITLKLRTQKELKL
ncbi:MAG: metallophosphoesterase [Gammaproteobacteria bacterium]|nr:metallophosphoesterase [Gammaproteobacteria bacterium]